MPLEGMVRSFIPILLLAAIVSSSSALSEPGEAAKQELYAAIKAEDEAKTKPGSSGSGRSGVAYMRNLDETVNQGNKQQIDYSLTQIAENYRTPAVSQALAKLQAALNVDAKAQEDAALAKIDALQKEVGEVIGKATKTKDLDPLLEKMEKLMESRSERRSEKISNAYQALRPMKQFVATWQDYLQARATGNRPKANQILSGLTSANGPLPVPRSMVIALIDGSTPAPAEAGAKPEEIKELDQIAPAIRQLRASAMTDRMISQSSGPMESELTIRALVPLDAAYQNFKAGLPVNIESILKPTDQPATSATSIAGLRAKLLLLVLPRQLGIAPNSSPKSGENVVQFLDRVEKEAGDRGDAAACIRVIETKQALNQSESAPAPKAAGLDFFRAGQAREAASQPQFAAISYQMALESGINPTLATMIGKRLDEIKKTHPEEYKQATERVLKKD